jgi:hypothetical protein
MSSKDLILESSLQVFFYDQLQEVNRKFLTPLPNETIYYSSLVMDNFGLSKKYFEIVEGKVREKTLGIKLLESTHMSKEKQKRILKDVGDTALIVCGYFSDSLNKKIIDVGYYQQLGQTAYSRLNNMIPSAYQVPAFFDSMAGTFGSITMMMNLISKKNEEKLAEPLLIISPNKIKAS